MTYTFDTDLLSDLYKDAYGFRPDVEYFKAWNEYTDDFKQTIWDRLLVDLAAAVEADRVKEWKGITDIEIKALGEELSNRAGEFVGLGDWKRFARAVDAKLKEKNHDES